MRFFRFKSFELVVSLGCMLMLGYLAWQIERGSRGIAYRNMLEFQVSKYSAELEKIKLEHASLEARVTELRPDALDPDLLDEMIRKSLNFGNPNQIVVHFTN